MCMLQGNELCTRPAGWFAVSQPAGGQLDPKNIVALGATNGVHRRIRIRQLLMRALQELAKPLQVNLTKQYINWLVGEGATTDG
jgi:hypothetical protein